MSDFTYVDVLLKAASRVEQEGMWCQKSMFTHDVNGRRLSACAVGALLISACELEAYVGDAINALSGHLNTGWGGVTAWNDEPGRTAFEVAEAMRKAAE